MEEKLRELIESHEAVHMECSKDIAHLVEKIVLSYPSSSLLNEDVAMYEYMKVKEYLYFFADLLHQREMLEQVIEYMHLNDFLYIPIHKCTMTQKRRILIAIEILKKKDIYYFEEPMRNLDEDSIKIVLAWYEIARKHHQKIITTSPSLKEVCLCDGYLVSIHHQRIDVIEENLQNVDEEEMMIQKISVKLNDRIFLLNPEDIDYIEADSGKAEVVVRGETYQSPFSMDELEKKLHRFGFYRCHRSYLVNMQKVTQIVKWTRNSYSLKLLNYDQVTVPLSKMKVQEMKDIYQF